MDEEYKIARHSKEYVKDIVNLSEKDVEKIVQIGKAVFLLNLIAKNLIEI